MKSLFQLLGVDRAVAYALLARGWSVVAAPITLTVLAASLSPATQGLYYTFGSIVALRSFFELGLTVVIVNLVSHEWSRLRIDDHGNLQGDVGARSRLTSLGRMTFRWYGTAAAAFALLAGGAGTWFFYRTSGEFESWLGPWCLTVLVAALQLVTMPLVAILEGCNQVTTITRFRLIQTASSTLLLWLAFAAGWGLWSVAVPGIVGVLSDLRLIGWRYRGFFGAFAAQSDGSGMNWASDVWPLQWRIGLQGIVGYFAFHLCTPVIFHYHGAAEAGRVGMSLAIANALGNAALVFMQTRAPLFGMLVAKRQFEALDRLARRLFVVSSAVLIASAAGVVFTFVLLEGDGTPLASRVVPPSELAVFLWAILLMHVSQCQSIYLRAHKREPWTFFGVGHSLLNGLLVWLLGSRYGTGGAAWAMAVSTGLFLVPVGTWLFFKLRRAWRHELTRMGVLEGAPV